MNRLPELFLLIFIMITFFFSFWDKVTQWEGNIKFLKAHFEGTFMGKMVPISLVLIVVLELLAGVFAAIGLYELFTFQQAFFGLLSCIFSLVTLFLFLIGQRVAKDYDGAMKIVVYIIPTVFCLYLLLQK